MSEQTRTDRHEKFEQLKQKVMKLGENGTPTITSLKKITRGLRELEDLYSPSTSAEGENDRYASLPRLALVHPTLFLTEAWRNINNVDRMIECALKLLRNFGVIVEVEGQEFKVKHNSGLVNVETVRALKYLAEGYRSRGEDELAKQCMERAKKWYLIISGAEVGMEKFLGIE